MSLWADEEVSGLIDVWGQKHIQQQFNCPQKNGRAYILISKLLRERGIDRSKSQVQSKVKALRQEYTKIIENRSTGNKLNATFFERIHAFLNINPITTPVYLSEIGPILKRTDAEDTDGDTGSPMDKQDDVDEDDLTQSSTQLIGEEADEEQQLKMKIKNEDLPQTAPKKRKLSSSVIEHVAKKREIEETCSQTPSMPVEKQRNISTEREINMSTARERDSSVQGIADRVTSNINPPPESAVRGPHVQKMLATMMSMMKNLQEQQKRDREEFLKHIQEVMQKQLDMEMDMRRLEMRMFTTVMNMFSSMDQGQIQSPSSKCFQSSSTSNYTPSHSSGIPSHNSDYQSQNEGSNQTSYTQEAGDWNK